MEQLIVDGQDQTTFNPDFPSGYTETYQENGVFTFNSSAAAGSGTWTFENDKEQIRRQGVSSQSTEDLTITRLTKQEFWYHFTKKGQKHEFKFIEN